MNQILQQLANLTNAYNQIINQARKIFELPWQNILRTGSKMQVANEEGVSEFITVQQIIDAALSVRQNQLLSIGTIMVAGNDLTIPAGATWLINNANYSNPSNIVINVPYAEDGNTRTDIIVADELNNMYRVNGPETVGVSPAPNEPLNTVLVTTVNVTDDSINETPAVPGVEYNTDDILNVSGVSGPTASDALNTLKTSTDSKLNKSDLKHQSEIFITAESGGSIAGSPSSYESFPLMLRALSGKVFLFTRNGIDHAGSDGIINMRSSTDGGLTFSAKTTISNSPGFDCRNVSGGVTSTGRIVLFYLRLDSSDNFYDQGYIYSDDEGATWSAYTTIGHGAHPAFSPYGKIIEIGNNELIMSWYAEGGPNNNALYIKKSTDNGTTWGTDILVASGTVLKYSEAGFAYIGGKSILCVARDTESTGSMVQLKSVDNGATWTSQGILSFGYRGVSPELSTYVDENHERWLALFYADRSDNKLYIISGKAIDLLNSASNWIAASKVEIDSNSNYDFGYPSVIHSDLSPNYLVSYYKAATVYANALIYFKKSTAYTVPNLKGSGTTNYLSKWASSFVQTVSSIFDNGTSVTVGNTNGNGKFNIFTGLTGITFDLANQPNGMISFSNGGSTATVPVISSKTNTNGGLSILSGTPDINSNSDMSFAVRKNDNTDFTTLTSTAFSFVRFGTTLISVLRNGNTTFSGNIAATSYAGTATLTGAPTAPTATVGTNTTQIATTAFVQANARPYKVYSATFTQAGTGAPIATISENTLSGAIVWTRQSTGVYVGTLSGAFPAKSKVHFYHNIQSYPGVCNGLYVSTGSISLQTTSNGVLTDGVLNDGNLEIRVYN